MMATLLSTLMANAGSAFQVEGALGITAQDLAAVGVELAVPDEEDWAAAFDGALTFTDSVGDVLICAPTGSIGTPLVIAHGLGEDCGAESYLIFQEKLALVVDATTRCVSVGGSGFGDVIGYITKNADTYVAEWADVMLTRYEASYQNCSLIDTSGNFNFIGISQGTLVGRGYLQQFQGEPLPTASGVIVNMDGYYLGSYPLVKNFMAVHGPLMGVAGLPTCKLDGHGVLSIRAFCTLYARMTTWILYSDFIQDNFFPLNYYVNPLSVGVDEPLYVANSVMARWNNEYISNATLKANFIKTQKLIMVKALKDYIVIPPESSWWGFYEPGSLEVVLPMTQTRQYTQDLFGLKTMHLGGRMQFIEDTAAAGHIGYQRKDMLEWVNQSFINDETKCHCCLAEVNMTGLDSADDMVMQLDTMIDLFFTMQLIVGSLQLEPFCVLVAQFILVVDIWCDLTGFDGSTPWERRKLSQGQLEPVKVKVSVYTADVARAERVALLVSNATLEEIAIALELPPGSVLSTTATAPRAVGTRQGGGGGWLMDTGGGLSPVVVVNVVGAIAVLCVALVAWLMMSKGGARPPTKKERIHL